MLSWYTRAFTNDLGIIEQVYTKNACRLPEDMSGQVMVDIGAHIGAASVLAAERGAKVYAFEPAFGSFNMLLSNSEGLNIRPFWLGIGPFGTRKLYTDPYNTGQSSTELLFPELEEETYEYITTITFKAMVDMLYLSVVDFLKIDCEGCEDFVLEDMAGSAIWPTTISVEFHRPDRTILQNKLIASLYDVEQFSNDGYILSCKL